MPYFDFQIIHFLKDEKKSGQAVKQPHYNLYMFRRDFCENEGQGKMGEQTLKRAEDDVGRRGKFNYFRCNSRNYANYWADDSMLCGKRAEKIWVSEKTNEQDSRENLSRKMRKLRYLNWLMGTHTVDQEAA